MAGALNESDRKRVSKKTDVNGAIEWLHSAMQGLGAMVDESEWKYWMVAQAALVRYCIKRAMDDLGEERVDEIYSLDRWQAE